MELTRLGHHGREVRGDAALQRPALQHRPHFLTHVPDEGRRIDAREIDGDPAGIDAAHVEDVPDQALHALGLAVQVAQQLPPLCFGQVEIEQQLAETLEAC